MTTVLSKTPAASHRRPPPVIGTLWQVLLFLAFFGDFDLFGDVVSKMEPKSGEKLKNPKNHEKKHENGARKLPKS